jgi:hypothetical protein
MDIFHTNHYLYFCYQFSLSYLKCLSAAITDNADTRFEALYDPESHVPIIGSNK